MDRSWISKNRLSKEYREGVQDFIHFIEDGVDDLNFIRCPCNQCENLYRWSIKEIKDHLIAFGINPNYTTWTWHGEDDPSQMSPRSSTDQPIDQDNEIDTLNDVENIVNMVKAINENATSDGDAEDFQSMLEDAKKPLYKGCTKYTKLSAVVKLFNIKAKSGWSDKSFSDVLTLFADMLPEYNELPLSTIEAKHTLSMFGMEYKRIHACPNDCILYRNEYENESTCPMCGMSRYKVNKNQPAQKKDEQNKGAPAKVLWYFPPISRFKRWFRSAQTTKDLTWHATEREVDGQLREDCVVSLILDGIIALLY